MKLRLMAHRVSSVVVFMLSMLLCKELLEWWELRDLEEMGTESTNLQAPAQRFSEHVIEKVESSDDLVDAYGELKPHSDDFQMSNEAEIDDRNSAMEEPQLFQASEHSAEKDDRMSVNEDTGIKVYAGDGAADRLGEMEEPEVFQEKADFLAGSVKPVHEQAISSAKDDVDDDELKELALKSMQVKTRDELMDEGESDDETLGRSVEEDGKETKLTVNEARSNGSVDAEDDDDDDEDDRDFIVGPPLKNESKIDVISATTLKKETEKQVEIKPTVYTLMESYRSTTQKPWSRQMPSYILDSYQKMIEDKAFTVDNYQVDKPQTFPSWINNYYILYVTAETALESVDIIPSSNILHVRVKSCSNAFIIYARNYQDITTEAYLLGLTYGTKGDTGVWKQDPNATQAIFPTPAEAKLNCDKLISFLVNYHKGAFQISLERHLTPFVTWIDPNPFEVKYVTLASPLPHHTSQWHLNVNTVQVLRTYTGPDYHYRQLWMTTVDRSHAYIAVRAARDVYIFISDKIGLLSSNGYEIALGLQNNTKCAVREASNGKNVLEIDTPLLLDGKAYKWTNGKLEVGRGTKVDKRELMTYARENHPKVASVGMTTGFGATGRWLFKQSDQTAPSSIM